MHIPILTARSYSSPSLYGKICLDWRGQTRRISSSQSRAGGWEDLQAAIRKLELHKGSAVNKTKRRKELNGQKKKEEQELQARLAKEKEPPAFQPSTPQIADYAGIPNVGTHSVLQSMFEAKYGKQDLRVGVQNPHDGEQNLQDGKQNGQDETRNLQNKRQTQKDEEHSRTAVVPSEQLVVKRDKTPDDPLGTDLRTVLRSVPSSVVALSTAIPTPAPLPPDVTYPVPHHLRGLSMSSIGMERSSRGLALSSFATVSLSPYPVVSLNIKTPSHTLSALKMSRQFMIHFLRGNGPGAWLAENLTKGFENQVIFKAEDQFKLSGNGLDIEPYPVKLTRESHVVLPVFNGWGLIGPILRCEVLQQGPDFEKIGDGFVQIGDHALVLGRVVEILQAQTKSTDRQYSPALTYNQGAFYAFNGINLHGGMRNGRKRAQKKLREKSNASTVPAPDEDLEQLNLLVPMNGIFR